MNRKSFWAFLSVAAISIVLQKKANTASRSRLFLISLYTVELVFVSELVRARVPLQAISRGKSIHELYLKH